MKKSAGILVYKKENNKIKVLISHMGGPYYKEKDKEAWSIPKGELEKQEDTLKGAIREFNEETNLSIEESNISFLASKKVSNNKLVVMFYKEDDFNLENCKSNYFELEWPKNSGKIEKFPEMDKTNWIEIEEAKIKVSKNQIYFLDKLIDKLKEND